MSESHGSHAHEPPPPPEPETPMWLPALGVALFVSVALWWAVTPKAPPPPPEEAPAASAAPQPSAAVRPGVAPGGAGSVMGGGDNAGLQRILDRLPRQ